jgi:hypothetical protein
MCYQLSGAKCLSLCRRIGNLYCGVRTAVSMYKQYEAYCRMRPLSLALRPPSRSLAKARLQLGFLTRITIRTLSVPHLVITRPLLSAARKCIRRRAGPGWRGPCERGTENRLPMSRAGDRRVALAFTRRRSDPAGLGTPSVHCPLMTARGPDGMAHQATTRGPYQVNGAVSSRQ